MQSGDGRVKMRHERHAVEKTLRTIGQEKLADEFVTTMSQAAEQAVPAAAAVFKGSLQNMTGGGCEEDPVGTE